ncbi:MAG: hypothetical protein SFV53_03235 [Rickettsiales bacterium]|nr:hypothetical protein [Rickettsiales bacterium]
MLLWLFIALGFVGCVLFWHFWQGITASEAIILFVAASIIFFIHLKFIYDKATTDHYLVSGYVTSLIHRPPFSYDCGRKKCYEPELWLIEQRANKPKTAGNYKHEIHSGDGIEECYGECQIDYPAPYKKDWQISKRSPYYHPIKVSRDKLIRTKLGETSTFWEEYFNPVQVSDEVIYDENNEITPYFKIYDYNITRRLIAPQIESDITDYEQKLEEVNSRLSAQNISLGLIITPDNLYFEKLKRSWHNGKANDFVIVVNSPNGETIRNVNIIGWNNYALKETVSQSIMALAKVDIEQILATVEDVLQKNQNFTPANFSQYHFLKVKIPHQYYWKIIIFQIVFFFYMMLLLKLNPNTKDYKLDLADVLRMWDKNFRPPHWNWFLHPLTPYGIVLYILIPFWVAESLF